MPELLGKVVEWNEARGYGFVQPLDTALPRAFFHVRDYRQDGRRPEAGELVRFSLQQQDDGRWRASGVRRAVATTAAKSSAPHGRGGRRQTATPDRSGWLGWGLLTLHLGVLAWAWWNGRLPLVPALGLPALWVVTWIVYAVDKDAAQRGLQRTPENTLHVLSLFGGWPGAWLAQRFLRHKNRKEGFQILFWCTVVFNAFVTWILLLRPS